MTFGRLTWILGCMLGISVMPSAGFAQHRREQDMESMTLTRLEQPAGYIHVVARGHGWVGQWEILEAMFGNETKVLALAVFPDGKGFSGLLPPDVPEGAMLTVHVKYQDAHQWTDLRFHNQDVRGAARPPLAEREDCSRPVVPAKSIGPVRLGMTVAQLDKLHAERLPGSELAFGLGPVRAFVQDGKVTSIRMATPTACIVDGARRRKVDLEVELPFADCTSTARGGVIIGHDTQECGDRGLSITGTSGHGEHFPVLTVHAARSSGK